MKRAASSISLNIAEGVGEYKPLEKAMLLPHGATVGI